MAESIHLNLDGAWSAAALPFATRDLRGWGPQLRFSTPSRLIEAFDSEIGDDLPRFVLYGSGDFHHLTALWIRRVAVPVVVVSFDNHPDWDVRPPRWCCGGWVNRALEIPRVEKVCVWGCGNFETWWPGRLFGNRRAEQAGRLEIYRWGDGRPIADQAGRGTILRADWLEKFSRFAQSLEGTNLYVTIDLDCLRAEDAVTNWENGRFTTDDVAWALAQLRNAGAQILRGDMCGAFSLPKYARRKQRFVAGMDHPKLPAPDLEHASQTNLKSFSALWPLLTD